MIALKSRAGQRIGVLGLVRTGLATVRALAAGGAQPIGWDETAAPREAARAAGVAVESFDELDFSTLDALVVSPGVPLTHPEPNRFVAKAMAAGTPVLGDIELFWADRPAGTRLVAITGTNGKSTTTALIGHILDAAGAPCAVGGNIGTAVLELDPLPDGGVYVVETSSYQLDLTADFAPDVAIWLNLTPDHLDRHGDMAGYMAAKRRIFANMKGGTLLLGIDEEEMRAMARSLTLPGVATVSVSVARDPDADLFVTGEGRLVSAGAPVIDLAAAEALRGAHNWQNAACAFGACRALGLSTEAIESGMRSFRGLAHRMEMIGRRGRVLFVNDSKATNAEAAARSLATYKDIHWIAGGRAKAGGIDDLRPFFERVTKAYLVGEAAPSFAESLRGRVETVLSGTVEDAVRSAASDAAASAADEPVVLLAPAAASFDQFTSFEVRGDAFRKAVAALPDTEEPDMEEPKA